MKTNLEIVNESNSQLGNTHAETNGGHHHDNHHHDDHDHSDEKSCCGDCQGGGTCKRYNEMALAIENQFQSNNHTK